MENRKISDKHIWLSLNGSTATLGITEYAGEKLGNIMFLNLPDVGEKLKTGQSFGDVESIKTVSDLISPVDGEVIKVNEELMDEPDVLNEDPYGSWLIEVKVEAVSDRLMDEDTYLRKKEEL